MVKKDIIKNAGDAMGLCEQIIVNGKYTDWAEVERIMGTSYTMNEKEYRDLAVDWGVLFTEVALLAETQNRFIGDDDVLRVVKLALRVREALSVTV